MKTNVYSMPSFLKRTYLLFFAGLLAHVSQSQTVTTVVGGAYNKPFTIIRSVAIDKEDNVYVCDTDPHILYKISPVGAVSRFAGSKEGEKDTLALFALLTRPQDVAVGKNGVIYFVEDDPGCKVRAISKNGYVSTLAGSTYGYLNGKGKKTEFCRLNGIEADQYGNLFLVDWDLDCVRKISPDSNVVTVTGSGYASGYTNGPKEVARFKNLTDVAVDTSTGVIFVTDYGNFCIRKIEPDGTTSTYAGTNVSGTKDGPGTEARFSSPFCLVLDAEKNLYVGDGDLIRKVSPLGQVTTFVGPGKFKGIYRMAINSKNELFVADATGYAVKKVSLVTGFHTSFESPSMQEIVFPNPVVNELHIRADLVGQTMRITNVLGTVMFEGNASDMEVSSYRPGVYHVLVSDGYKKRNFSFIKN